MGDPVSRRDFFRWPKFNSHHKLGPFGAAAESPPPMSLPMEFQRDIAPPPAEKPIEVEQERPRQTRVGGMSFSEALAKVEAHRGKVQGALGFAMLTRIIADFDVMTLVR